MTDWREPTDTELETLQKSLIRGVPDKWRHTVDRITINQSQDNKALMFVREEDRWVVTDVDPIFITEDYWCPSDQSTTICPGPCPDGREHVRIS